MSASYELDRHPANVAVVAAERDARAQVERARKKAERDRSRAVAMVFEAIIEDVANGQLAMQAIAARGVTYATFYRYMYADEDRRRVWAEAKITGSHTQAEEVVALADDAAKSKKPGAVAAATLQANSRRWYTAHVNPRAYGDKFDVTSDGKPITGVVLLPPLAP